MFAIPRTIFARSTDYGRPMKPFFIKRQFGQIKFGVLSVDFTLARTEIIYPKNVGTLVAMNFTQDKYSAPRAIEKMKILGALLELPAKQHCQFGQLGPIMR